jgi:N-acetylmuramoyl-L-alanine amidase
MNLISILKTTVLAAALGIVGGAGQAMATTTIGAQPVGQTATLLAQTFGNTPVNENNFLVVAVPGPVANPYQLFIVEQVSSSRPCWQIVNSSGEPTEVNPLWNTFDYTGVCRIQKDSNGYAIWASQDLGPGGLLQVRERNGDLLLQYRPSITSNDRITIGRANGISSTGFTQIDLNPGWSLTKRTFDGRIVDSNLVYFTNNNTFNDLLIAEGGDVPTQPTEPTTPTQPPVTPTQPAFRDISGNLYANQITRAAELGIMAGFQDGTFKPNNPLTREQAASIVMEAAYLILPSSLIAQLPQAVFSAPFSDVAQNRWSAVKIEQARSLGIIVGDAGTSRFRPTSNVTRAELMAMLAKLAKLSEFAQAADPNETLVPGVEYELTELIPNTPNAPTFVDISGHWGAGVINEMAGFCGIATPLNETGSNFAPNTNALRDYAAAATVRLVDCPESRPGTALLPGQ